MFGTGVGGRIRWPVRVVWRLVSQAFGARPDLSWVVALGFPLLIPTMHQSCSLSAAAILCAALSLDASAQVWTQLTPAPFPLTLARRSGGIAFDPGQGKMLVYGGLQSGPTVTLNETWTFDGTVWAQLTPTTTPPPRWGHRMVYDTLRNRIVTFGGRSPTTTANANDTWEWDGTTSNWLQVFPSASPNARAFYSMVYDENRHRVVIYGTQSGSVVSGGNQTWEYDGTTWAQVVTATTPPGLETPAMAYDKRRGVTVMFGGSQSATLFNTTWEYDGINWVQRTPSVAPTGRYRAGCVYDDYHQRVLLYGGFGGGVALTDTWEYDGNNWTQILSGGPLKSTEAFVGFLPTFGQTVHFGGSAPAGTNNETWLFTSPTAVIPTYSKFGNGCAGPIGTPTNQSTGARIGQNFVVDVGNCPTPELALFYIGVSNTTSSLGALPIDLGLLGAPGCFARISPDISQFGFGATGLVSFSTAIPNDPYFLSVSIYTQAFPFSASNAFGLIASDAAQAVIGN